MCYLQIKVFVLKILMITDIKMSNLDAAFVIIASMGLGGVRKLEVELGESAMVMGLGLLGMFSVQFFKLSGANPIIAADLNPKRRELAVQKILCRVVGEN